jgi:hypothetical protein
MKTDRQVSDGHQKERNSERREERRGISPIPKYIHGGRLHGSRYHSQNKSKEDTRTRNAQRASSNAHARKPSSRGNIDQEREEKNRTKTK